jgi:carboxypeptidase PM20D1
MSRIFRVLGAALLSLIVLTATLTARYRSDMSAVPPAVAVPISSGAAERLAGAIRIQTISAEDPAAFDSAAFARLHAYLETAFPRVHAQLRRETVAQHSLLYAWHGADASLDPILLLGHLDVVPVEPSTDKTWQQEPFGGRIVDGAIWGRGAIDNKSAVVGILEAVEMLLAEGFRPQRTVYFAFGHDEEVGGAAGAKQIAALLQRRGVELEMVLDEGGVIGEGILPGMADPIALVGIAEKGFATIELLAQATGGHSSLPPRQSAAGILSTAIARLETEQMPARLDGPTRQLFERIGPRLPMPQRAVFANLWLTRPIVTRALEAAPTTNAMLRTTTAVTIVQAGTKDNVLPTTARAVVNFRIRPGDSVSSVVEHVRRTVNDKRVQIQLAGRFSAEPSAVSSSQSEAFRRLERAIRRVNADVVVAPYLVVVATDARHYSDLSRSVFRLLPVRLTARDLQRMHGIDERIGIREYEAAVRTYRQLLMEAASSPSTNVIGVD